MLVADLDVRILDTEGTVLRHLTLDPARDYQVHSLTATFCGFRRPRNSETSQSGRCGTRTHDLSRVNPSWVVSVTWGTYGKSRSEGK